MTLRSLVGALVAVVALSAPRAARAAVDGAVTPFACRGEALALMVGLSIGDIRAERDKRIDEAAPEDDTPGALAHRHCVLAQVMARLGDTRAADEYERAIEANPEEGGYELWYAHYLGGMRGPRYPLLESAEVHLYRALEKVRRRRQAGAVEPFDATTEEWAERKLLDLYQEDGLPLTPWKAFPYGLDGTHAPGLALAAGMRFSVDTNDFVDVSDVRKFTSEAAFAASSERLARPLTREELEGIARAPLRYEVYTRTRIRQHLLGALDLVYRSMWIKQGQIVRFNEPNTFGDAQVEEYGVNLKKPLGLYPLFDVMLEGGYRRVNRVGIVEWLPEQKEEIDLVELKPVLSRFIGPDKLTVGFTYVHMGIPPIVGGPIDERKRERAIRAFNVDYAMYRPFVLPKFAGPLVWKRMDTRGFHVFGGAAIDDEVFGTRVAQRRDYYGGISLRGLGAWDFTLQETVFVGGGTQNQVPVPELAGTQLRTTIVLLHRIIDGDATPGLPEAGRPAFLNLVLPLRHDLALDGLPDFESVRAGAELWTRFIPTWLRGPSLLVSAGYAFQYFYRLDKGLHVVRADVGLGW
jgi:hypothetical protein